MTVINITWEKFQKLSLEISSYITRNNNYPDAIIGIARGGLPLMTTLSSFLKIRSVGVIFMESTITDDIFSIRHQKAICNGYYLPPDLTDKDVLLVDDIIRSGATVKAALGLLAKENPKSIEIVSIFKQDSYEFRCFAPEKIKSNDWIVFPWDNLS